MSKYLGVDIPTTSVTIDENINISTDMLKALHESWAARKKPVAIALGPKQYLELRIATMQRFRADRPDAFHGLPIYLQQEDGIRALYETTEAARLHYENQIAEEKHD